MAYSFNILSYFFSAPNVPISVAVDDILIMMMLRRRAWMSLGEFIDELMQCEAHKSFHMDVES